MPKINADVFEVWFARLKAIASKQGWHLTEGEEWMGYYSRGLSPEVAFNLEVGNEDDECDDDPAGY